MGFFGAVRSVYGKYFTFSGRASRAEFWWFQVFVFIASFSLNVIAVIVVLAMIQADPSLVQYDSKLVSATSWMEQNADLASTLSIAFGVIGFFAFTVPGWAVTVRRLHDTDRRGWWLLKPALLSILLAFAAGFVGARAAVPEMAFFPALIAGAVGLVVFLWYLLVFCQAGTTGENRFGPDPKDELEGTPSHPAFASKLTGADAEQAEALRKAEIRALYRDRVLAGAKKA